MSDKKPSKLSDLGERDFLSLISSLVDTPVLPFNDDASAILIDSDNVLVINADMLVSSTDVLPNMSAFQIGKKAVSMSVSDIISKGISPSGFLASIAFPKDLPSSFAVDILRGVKFQCDFYHILFLGGDLNESSETIIDSISFGFGERSSLLPRHGLQSGDLLYVTGYFGYTSLAFRMLLSAFPVPDSLKSFILPKVYEPVAQYHFLPLLQSGFVTSCIDSSDGLYLTLLDLANANNLSVNITNVPIAPEILSFASKSGLNAVDLALFGGEEYELVMGIKQENQRSFELASSKLGLKTYLIGYLTESDEKISISDPRFANFNLENGLDKSFIHFKS